MKRVLKYYFKKRFFVVGVISFIFLLITFISLYNDKFIIERYYEFKTSIEAYNSPFGMLALFAAIIGTIVVPLEFSFKMNKIKIDQLYSLPIKREKIFISKLIICIVETVIPLTLSFILSFLMVVFKKNIFDLKYFIPYYFLLVFYSVVLITTFAFIYTRANRNGDGIVNMIAYAFLLLVIIEFTNEYFNLNKHLIESTDFLIYSPISIINDEFDKLLCNIDSNFKTSEIISLILFPIIGGAFFYLFVKLNKEDKSEDCLEVSNSLFSYRLFLPIYGICLGSLVLELDSFSLYIFVIISLYIGYVIKNRNFKLNNNDFKWYISLVIISFILGVLGQNIFY